MVPMHVNSVLVIVAILALSSVWATEAHGYLDAGTGSMLLQVAVAGATAAAFVARSYWRRLKAGVTGQAADDEPSPLDESEPADDTR